MASLHHTTLLCSIAAAPDFQRHSTDSSTRQRITAPRLAAMQVGSHYHFLETNAALEFDRELAYGRRLNVPAGSSIRLFEPLPSSHCL